MNLVVGLNRRCELKSSRPATPRARPAATKIPIEVALAFLLMGRTCSGGLRRCIFGRVLPTFVKGFVSAKRVAQICNLLYRRFVIGSASEYTAAPHVGEPSRLQTCDTADYKS